MREVFDESAIKIAKSQKGLYSLFVFWSWPVHDCLYLLRVHLYGSMSYDHTKVGHFLAHEFALRGFQVQVIVLEVLEDLLNYKYVHLFIVSKNEDIIHVDDYMSLINQILE